MNERERERERERDHTYLFVNDHRVGLRVVVVLRGYVFIYIYI